MTFAIKARSAQPLQQAGAAFNGDTVHQAFERCIQHHQPVDTEQAAGSGLIITTRDVSSMTQRPTSAASIRTDSKACSSLSLGRMGRGKALLTYDFPIIPLAHPIVRDRGLKLRAA